MNSSYLNMAAGAFLGTCFVAMSLSIVSGAIYDSPEPAKEGFAIKAAEGGEGAAAAPAKAEVPPIAPLLAKADVDEGAKIFKKCEACHNAEKGGPNKIGPNLYGVVGRPIATHEGFSYSSALKEFSKDGKETWTYEHLNHFIHGPRDYISGTAMTFPGVKKDQERADVIAYLHTLSDNPVPFPKPEEAAKDAAAGGEKAGEAGKPAEGAAPADAGKENAAPAKDGAAAPAKQGEAPAKDGAAPADAGKSGTAAPADGASGQKAPANGASGEQAPAAPADGSQPSTTGEKAPTQSTPDSGATSPEKSTTGSDAQTPAAGDPGSGQTPAPADGNAPTDTPKPPVTNQ